MIIRETKRTCYNRVEPYVLVNISKQMQLSEGFLLLTIQEAARKDAYRTRVANLLERLGTTLLPRDSLYFGSTIPCDFHAIIARRAASIVLEGAPSAFSDTRYPIEHGSHRQTSQGSLNIRRMGRWLCGRGSEDLPS
ncbi:hypothetical protein PILCRDRAFT_175400 [Piloderma croceum F 1598]|uniref:Uncharacterized protein n=1 Tax=Piloderma croceum (strain F 1598) TaxID=765440 RepID=A0A0C3CKM3_PILCF|nr:hypothetical protein PILCRDRAFT_175400 [Piloderma croceum F 1598]